MALQFDFSSLDSLSQSSTAGSSLPGFDLSGFKPDLTGFSAATPAAASPATVATPAPAMPWYDKVGKVLRQFNDEITAAAGGETTGMNNDVSINDQGQSVIDPNAAKNFPINPNSLGGKALNFGASGVGMGLSLLAPGADGGEGIADAVAPVSKLGGIAMRGLAGAGQAEKYNALTGVNPASKEGVGNAAMFAGGDVAAPIVGGLLGKAARSLMDKMKSGKTLDPNLDPYDTEEPATLPALTGAKDLPMLGAGEKPAGELTGQTSVPGEGGFDNAPEPAKPGTYTPSLKPYQDAHDAAVNNLLEGLETTHNYVGHYDPLAPYFGQDEVDALPKKDRAELAKSAYDDLKDKTGVDVNKLIAEERRTAAAVREQQNTTLKGRAAAGAEKRRWERIVGAKPSSSETNLHKPGWVKPAPAGRLSTETNVANTVLKGYKKYSLKNVQKIWDAFPELQSDHPQVKDYLDKQAQKTAQASQDGAGTATTTAQVQTPKATRQSPLRAKTSAGNKPIAGGPGASSGEDIYTDNKTTAPDLPKVAPVERARILKQLNNSGKSRKSSTTPGEWMKQTPRNIYRLLVHSGLAFDSLAKNIEKSLSEYGLDLSDRDNPAQQYAAKRYANQRALTNIFVGLRDSKGNAVLDGQGKPMAPLKAIFDGLGKDKQSVKDWEDYLVAKRAVYKLAAGKAVYPHSYDMAPADDATNKAVDDAHDNLMNVKDSGDKNAIAKAKVAHESAKDARDTANNTAAAKAQVIVDQMDRQHPDFNARSEQLYDWQRKWGKAWLVDTGLVSDTTYKKWMDSDPAYIPFYRVMAPVERSAKTIGSHFVGSERNIVSSFESIPNQILWATNKAMRNKIATSMYDCVIKYGPDAGKDAPDIMTPLGVRLQESNPEAKASDAAHEDMSKVLGDDTTQEERDDEDQVLAKHGNSMIARVNGHSVPLKIDNPELMDTIRRIQPEQLPTTMKIMGKVTQMMSNAQVGYNPFFTLLKQPAIEQPGYALTSKTVDHLNPLWLPKYGMNFIQAFTDVMRGHLGLESKDYANYKALGGGGQGFSGRMDAYGEINPAKQTKMNNAIHATKQVLSAVDTTLTDTARLAEFKRQLGVGATKEKAFTEAQDLGINFGRHGDFNFSGIGGMFVNAGIQGVDKMARSIIQRPAQTVAGAVSTLTAGSMILYAVNRNNPNYTKLSQADKDNNYCIPDALSKDANGWPNKFIKIEKPKGWGLIFSTVPEHIMTAIDKKDPKQLDNWTGEIWKTLVPVDASTVFDGAIQAYANKSYSGGPIVSAKLSTLPPGLQGDKIDSAAANFIGSKINYPPKKIDYLANAYGGVWSQALHPGKTIQSDLIANPASANDIENNFYNLRTQLNQGVAAFKLKGVKSKAYNPGLNAYVNKIATQVDALGKAQQNIQNSSLPQAQKDASLAALKQRQQDIMQQAYQKAEGMM